MNIIKSFFIKRSDAKRPDTKRPELMKLKFIFLNCRGASATEYGLIIAGVALALIFVFSVLTGTLNDGFDFIMNTIFNALGIGS